MKQALLFRFHLSLLSYMLFICPQSLTKETSSGDKTFVDYNQNVSYICFDKKFSDIAHVVAHISALDDDLNSPIHALKQHLDNGYSLGLREEVMNVLEYADWFIDQYADEEVKRSIAPQLDQVIDHVLNGSLDVSEQDALRSPEMRLTVSSKARFKENVRMNKKLYVHGKAHFDKDVEFKDNVNINDDLTVVGNLIVQGDVSAQGNLTSADATINNHNIGSATVTGDLSAADLFVQGSSVLNHLSANDANFFDFSAADGTVTGTLSTRDEVVEFDLTVGGNIKMNDSTATTGNILKNNNIFIHNQGNSNTAVGSQSLAAITIGSSNTSIGIQSLQKNTQGSENTVLGSSALSQNTVGSFNVAIGTQSGLAHITGSSNTFIGHQSGYQHNSGDLNIYIGKQVGFNGAETGVIRIGNKDFQDHIYVAAVYSRPVDPSSSMPVLVDSDGKLGTVTSSKRFKHNIKNMKNKSERIYNLNPVQFVYNHDGLETKQYGLIAEEVAHAFPELVINDKDGAPFTVRYELLPVLLLNEMQKMAQKVATIDELNKQMITLNEAFNRMKQHIQEIETRH